jgi:hypothetical protein
MLIGEIHAPTQQANSLGHSKQNGRRQHSSNVVEAVSEEKLWWSVRASDIYFR